MFNMVGLVGRLVSEPTIENNKVKFTLACPRSFKNENGVYETDFIDIISKYASSIDYLRKGDAVGVRGRIETFYYEDENNMKRKATRVVGVQLSFISSYNTKGDENNE